MKTTNGMSFTVMALLTTLAIPVQLAAQDSQHRPHQPHHYQLVDMGTFGGPQSAVFGGINNHGVLVGYADTSTPDPYPPFCFIPDCFVTHAFQWQNGAVTDLGVLPNGGAWSSASTSISSNGLIAGFSQNGEFDPLFPGFPEAHAVLWKQGKIIDLGTLGDGYESMAYAVNSQSQVVGGAVNTVPDSNSFCLDSGNCYYFPPFPAQVRAFLWQDGVMQDLGTLGGTDALATLINERGQVVGTSYTSSGAGGCGGFALATGAFIWDNNNGMRDLGSFGGTCTLASDLNDRGQVVGSSDVTGDTFERAFLWEHGSIHHLGGSLGGNNTGAFAINEHGQAVGFAFVAGDTLFHAALWKHVGQITDVGVVGSDTCSYAAAINAKGQVVGDSKPGCGPDSDRSFLWEDGSIFDLNTLIPSGSALYLQFIQTINDRGEISGSGADANGNEHAFLLIPCDEQHPGVEGCDYTLVDAAAATRVSPPPAQQAPASRTPMLNVPGNRMLRPFGRRAMPGQRALGMGQAPGK